MPLIVARRAIGASEKANDWRVKPRRRRPPIRPRAFSSPSRVVCGLDDAFRPTVTSSMRIPGAAGDFLLIAAPGNPQRCLRLSAAAFVLLLVTLEPGDWGRKPWTADYFGFEAPALSEPRNTIVVVTGHDPMAYMIPFFPPEVRFLRIQGFMTGPSPTPNLTDRLMQAAIAKHTGSLFIIYRQYEEWSALNALEAYGLRWTAPAAWK
jgi:hypothetical protein